jgi:polar amino acid transport system permease protein
VAEQVQTTSAPSGALPLEVVRLRHPGRWVAVAFVVLLLALLVKTLITNDRYQWDVVFSYLFSGSILNGLGNTLILTVIAMVVGLVLGVLLAVSRDSKNPVVSGAAALYIGLFRGTPLLVQLIFWFIRCCP